MRRNRAKRSDETQKSLPSFFFGLVSFFTSSFAFRILFLVSLRVGGSNAEQQNWSFFFNRNAIKIVAVSDEARDERKWIDRVASNRKDAFNVESKRREKKSFNRFSNSTAIIARLKSLIRNQIACCVRTSCASCTLFQFINLSLIFFFGLSTKTIASRLIEAEKRFFFFSFVRYKSFIYWTSTEITVFLL